MEDGQELDFGCGPVVDQKLLSPSVTIGDVLTQLHEVVAAPFVSGILPWLGENLDAS